MLYIYIYIYIWEQTTSFIILSKQRKWTNMEVIQPDIHELSIYWWLGTVCRADSDCAACTMTIMIACSPEFKVNCIINWLTS